MKKLFVKCAAFAAIFVLLFLGAQRTLSYKADKSEYRQLRYRSLQSAPADSIDVLFLGSSPTYAGITPMAMWHEAGVTAFNLGTSNNTAMLCYYDLKFALETQRPKLVVLDFNLIFEDRKASDVKENGASLEVAYRKALSMPSSELRGELRRQILEDCPDQDPAMWYVPMLRYHSRWNELTSFDFEKVKPEEYKEYQKGALMRTIVTEAPVKYSAEAYAGEQTDLPQASDYALGYYKKAIELCGENGIAVAAVFLPRSHDASYVRKAVALDGICEQLGVSYYDLDRPESWETIGVDAATDFYDAGHMNLCGSMRVSAWLAERLQADFGLPDHRGDAAFADWEEGWNDFCADYAKKLREYGY